MRNLELSRLALPAEAAVFRAGTCKAMSSAAAAMGSVAVGGNATSDGTAGKWSGTWAFSGSVAGRAMVVLHSSAKTPS